MQLPLPVLSTAFAQKLAMCLAAASLIGCASKNPLMEEPAAAVKPAAPASASTAPAVVKPAEPSTLTGVETSRERRFFGIFSPYRVDVQQGNFISGEMLSQIKPGMTPDQVRFVLGTPLLVDIFHADRWDYVFRLEKGNGRVVTSRVAVHFKDNRLARIEAGDLPSEEEYLSLIAGTPPAPKKAAK